MSGSKFVEGILSCGVEVELAKAVMAANQSYANQMLEVGAFLQGESFAAKKQSDQVENAERALAQVDMDNANTQLYQGITQVMGPAVTAGGRLGRETGLIGRENGLFGQGAGKTLGEINEEGQNVSAWKKALQEGEPAQVIGDDGKPAANPLAAKDIKDEEILNLKHGKYASSVAEKDQRLAAIKALKNFRGEVTTDAAGNRTQTPRGKAYDDVESKLNDEEKAVQNHQQRFDSTTDRWSQYMQSFTQAASGFAGYTGGKRAADDRTAQAHEDAVKTICDYGTQGQKSAADQALQGSQNSAQAIAELNRAKSEIAQANRM